MSKKVICVVANGYAEEMMASMLMKQMRIELQESNIEDQYQFVGGSLVSSGKWFQEEKFATFFVGGVTPSGGFPTRSWKGFFKDLFAGVFIRPFKLMKFIKEWERYNLDMVIIVGDFLLMMLAVPVLKRKKIPLIFIPTAKSNYIQAHYKIEKYFIKKYATISYTRDQITADDFNEYGINVKYLGNLIQDLINLQSPKIYSDTSIVALLPGSREEAYKNFEMILLIVEQVSQDIHWAFVQANSLSNKYFIEIFQKNQWNYIKDKENSYWGKNNNKIFVYSNTEFDSIALSCQFAISLAGTGGEQIVGLGKPVIGFVGSGPQSTNRRMIDNYKLLGQAFIYEKEYPNGVVNVIKDLLKNEPERQRLGQIGLEYMGKIGATKKIAHDISNYLKK